MKATILLATLKKEGLSNTETLSQFLQYRMAQRQIDCKIIKLVDYTILPGTCSDMGSGDEWPSILQQVLESNMLIFATPVWWGNHSSLMQRVIERLDELHDKVMAGEPSPLESMAGGIVITGDSDGAQHVIGNIANFFNAIGLVLPPYGTLSVLWERQGKGEHPSREQLLAKYDADYAGAADKMIAVLQTFAGR